MTEGAERVVAELCDKRASTAERIDALSAERQLIAYAAHTGDMKARKRLDALNAESATFAGEIEGIDAAIVEAGARLEAARRAEALADDQAAARALRAVVAEFQDHARGIDQAFADVVKRAEAFAGCASKMRDLGADRPSDAQLMALGARALKTALMKTPWARAFEHLPPGERHTISELADVWAKAIEATIAQRLGETLEVS